MGEQLSFPEVDEQLRYFLDEQLAGIALEQTVEI